MAQDSKKTIIINNLLAGIAWGLGTVVGATVMVAILVGFLSTVNFVPVVGNFAADVMHVIQTKQMQK